MKPEAKCGSTAGYKRHIRNEEEVCPDCRDARNEYVRDYRAKNPPSPLTGGPRSGKSWSEEEVEYVEANPDLTAREVGEDIGRGEAAVQQMRRKIRNGTLSPVVWTDEEVAFVRSTPHLTYKDVAKRLKKRPSTVRGLRQRLGRHEGVRFDVYDTKDPHAVGKRRLLAKTCTKCGLLLEANWFTSRKSGSRTWFSACVRCSPRGGESRVPKEVRKDQNHESQQRLQSLSLPHAVNSGQPYTGADHKVLAEPDLTILEKAIKIGRTYFATNAACSTNGYASRVGLGDPMKGVWVIDNPNAEMLEVAS